MELNNLNDIIDFDVFLNEDNNGRTIKLYNLKNCQFNKNKTFYPDIQVYSHNNNLLYNPVNESIMSLGKKSLKPKINLTIKKIKSVESNPVFYFIYNTENYYHFIYDTLPYLITFISVKEKKPELKLLINYPNKETKHVFNFVSEFLELIGVEEKHILFVNEETIYENIFISSSYTHDINSNLPPRNEIYEFYRWIVNSNKNKFIDNTPKKIYISRRSWLHSDYSNIGTNYTLKRKMENEDDLVKVLELKGYEEVFTEKLNTLEKLNLFYNSESVIGAIGGGLCNVLFSKPETKLLTIVSPTFLDLNNRFKYSLDCVNNKYFYDTTHSEFSEFKTGMRVECEFYSIIGEIESISDNVLNIIYSDDLVSGWSNQVEYKKMSIPGNLCKKLDFGLNSPFFVNIENIKDLIF
jgi:hypothetical protein